MQLGQFTGIMSAGRQCLKELLTLIQGIIPESNHQIPGLYVVLLNQPKGLSGGGAEFGNHSKPWCDLTQKGNGALGIEIVETQRNKCLAAPATIWGQQMQFAAEAVTDAKGDRSGSNPFIESDPGRSKV